LQEDVLLDFSAKQRETKRQIEKVIAAHGDLVSTEVLIAYNINPGESISWHYHSGLLYAEMLGYKITSNPTLNNHKIEKI
jgi:predicted transcriptional regulator